MTTCWFGSSKPVWTSMGRVAVLVLIVSVLARVSAEASDYLTTGEIAGITGGTGAVFLLGQKVNSFDSTSSVFWVKPSSFELRLQKLLGGSYYEGKTNLLDSRFGAAITPISATVLLGISDLAWPGQDKSKGFFQDQFLFLTGITATKAVTDISKGIFRRRRPSPALAADLTTPEARRAFRYNHQSFFSGHTSAAFFSMAFLNIRVRSIMRSEMNASDYRNWRWAPPTLFFGWASVVGWSRIHAYKHYISDVAGGALAGWLVAELFHSFAGDLYDTEMNGTAGSRIISVTFPL